ncbi:MAG: hypothetical protein ACTSUD_11305 [Alphaproteobacteria bacterium]
MSNRNAASLTGSLLVRKGAASPSSFGHEVGLFEHENGLEARPSGQSGSASRPSPVIQPPANDKFSAAPAGGPAKVRRFTLRLSGEEHLRLRLASVYLGRSGQKLVLEAVNQYLERVAPELSDENLARTFGFAHMPSPPAKR